MNGPDAERVTFGGLGLGLKSAGTLEGLLEMPDSAVEASGVANGSVRDAEMQGVRGGVVLAHPHPLYGGTMRQPLVHHVAKACRAEGFATLRFNFRGVGRSGGSFHGIDERDDVRAAVRYLRDRLGVGTPVAVMGYSFGSMMAALAAAEGEPMDALVLVALVLRWDSFGPEKLSGLEAFRGPMLAVCGEGDELAPPDDVEAFLKGSGLDHEIRVVGGADHFFRDSFDELGSMVAHFLSRVMG